MPDVSIAQVEAGVVEILASHGDTNLGGDDFDQRLLDFVCDRFQAAHGIDLRASLAARSRLLSGVEAAKKRLSFEPIVTIAEEFITEDDGVPLNLNLEITRAQYEELIQPLLAKTLKCVDQALTDAKLQAQQIQKILLVGGATRTPLVHHLLATRLGRPVHAEIEPDLAVAMGAAVQAGLIAGADVGPVLVDVTPHSLGIEVLDGWGLSASEFCFSPIIGRNTPLPATRTEVYSTSCDGQTIAEIRLFQGEDEDTRLNTLVGDFRIEGLAAVPAPNEILVRLDLDLNGILRVTATERATGLARHVVIDNMMERFRQRERVDALERIDALFGELPVPPEGANPPQDDAGVPDVQAEIADPVLRAALEHAANAITRAERLLPAAPAEDAAELKGLLTDLRSATARRSAEDVERILAEVDDLLFYLQDQ